MRLFVAVFPPNEISQDLRRRIVGTPARLTPVAQWHVTLAFIGEVAPERLPDVERALAAVTVPRGLELRLRGGGRFVRTGSTVLWAAVEGDLAGLHAAIRQRLDAAGLPYDGRDFTPHLTVAYADEDGVWETLEGYQGPWWALAEIALVRTAANEGYTRLKTW